MKRLLPYLLSSVSFFALIGTSAAADLPIKAPAAAAPAPWTWTGFYVGINGGAAWNRATADVHDAAPSYASSTVTSTGGTFGGQLGYNWQWQNVVTGIEADWNWVDASGANNLTNFPGYQFTSKLSSLVTVRGRLGVTFSPTMLYVTGGLAAGKVDNEIPQPIFGGYPPVSETKIGWTVGGGIEHMFAQHWTAKAEVLYIDLGNSSVQGYIGSGYDFSSANTAVIARVGLNYKF